MLALAVLSGCASTGGGGDSRISREERYYLLRPTEGYPLTISTAVRDELEQGYTRLVERGDTRGATQIATDLLGQNPELGSARVLAAQSLFVQGQHDQVVSSLTPVVAELSGYTAAQLLYGRSSEKLGNLVEALTAYRSVSEKSPLARSRSLDLEARATEIVGLRIEDALAKGDPARAKEELEQLQEWAPDAERTVELTAEVARALDDPAAELTALRRLTRSRPDDVQHLERRARLEMEIGDPAAGLRLLEEAVSRDPENAELAEALTRAQFVWRLQLLPPEVRDLAQSSGLTRADFATLLFWVFPEIRYGRTGDARIANDILQHPNREQIMKVVNAGIMDVDPSLHQFSPYRDLSQIEAQKAVLRILARQSPPPACLGGGRAPRSTAEICRVSATCGLIESEADCVPTMPVDGPESMGLLRVTQELLGVE